jgi:hypothetical protein
VVTASAGVCTSVSVAHTCDAASCLPCSAGTQLIPGCRSRRISSQARIKPSRALRGRRLIVRDRRRGPRGWSPKRRRFAGGMLRSRGSVPFLGQRWTGLPAQGPCGVDKYCHNRGISSPSHRLPLLTRDGRPAAGCMITIIAACGRRNVLGAGFARFRGRHPLVCLACLTTHQEGCEESVAGR